MDLFSDVGTDKNLSDYNKTYCFCHKVFTSANKCYGSIDFFLRVYVIATVEPAYHTFTYLEKIQSYLAKKKPFKSSQGDRY